MSIIKQSTMDTIESFVTKWAPPEHSKDFIVDLNTVINETSQDCMEHVVGLCVTGVEETLGKLK